MLDFSILKVFYSKQNPKAIKLLMVVHIYNYILAFKILLKIRKWALNMLLYCLKRHTQSIIP